MIVEGQLHGGVVQGIGQAYMEQAVYDEEGQLLTGSFMDYAMPRAVDVPAFTVADHGVPTKTNPLGVKGVGEAGCAGGLPCAMNAVLDALADEGVRHIDMPLTPFRIWQALQTVKSSRMSMIAAVRGASLAAAMLFAALLPARAADPATADDTAKFLAGMMPSADSRLIATVCAAHLRSHYYLLMLAPLLAFVRADFQVSYTQLALALTVFNVVSGVLQTPVGFLVDRIGARVFLIVGLALSSAAFAIAGLFNSYWVFIAMYGVAGLGNTVYHPANYSLLSHHSPPERLSHIFAFHTFAGMLGSAIAPVTLLAMQSYFGWRGAYIGERFSG